MIQTEASYSLSLILILARSLIGLHCANGLEKNVSYVQTLTRQRRYLVFPLGSSIQVLWDQDIYISDYGQYLLTGFTVALSWELPSRPTYPEWERVGTSNDEPESLSSLKNRKDKNIQSNTSTSNLSSKESTLRDQEADFKNHLRNYYEFLKNKYPNRLDQNLFKNGNKSTNIIFPYSPEYNATNGLDAFTQYMIASYFEPWLDSVRTTSKTPDSRTPNAKIQNTVYPAMKKRYVRTASTSQENIFYLNHHRQTRHDLFTIIEKYLSAKSLNGTACVMKAICEMNERQHQTEPGPFLAEIFRVIFSLPASNAQPLDNQRHIKYDEANHGTNCVNKYENCPGSVWDVEISD